MSKTQVDKLGDRLRSEAVGEDLDLLQNVIGAHKPALDSVASTLHVVGLDPTIRLKTWQTIVQKLRRESARLSQIQDIAGARLTVDRGRFEQDQVVEQLKTQWPDARVIDRRTSPTYGYRAVHVVVLAEGCPVEIQVRTPLQDLWAQVLEGVAISYGRDIRYGIFPDSGPIAALCVMMIQASELIARVEMAEHLVALCDRIPPELQTSEQLEQRADAIAYSEAIRGPVGEMAASLRTILDLIQQAPDPA
jgi:ppGpp synthetase/RelA/SpoT-type nucleotidyltranferase